MKEVVNALIRIYSNYFTTENAPLAEISARYYECEDEIAPTEQYRITKRAEWACFNEGLYAASRGTKVLFLSSGRVPVEKIVVDRYTFILADDPVLLSAARDQKALETMLTWAMKKRIYSLQCTGPDNQTYYECGAYKREYFDFHHGFALDVEVLPDGRAGVWIDPRNRWKQPASTFINWLTSQGYSDAEIRTHLIGRRVRCPSPKKNKDYMVGIKDVVFQEIGAYPWEYEGEKTLYGYWMKRPTHRAWLDRRRLTLHPSDRPVVIVEGSFLPGGQKPYPASVIEFPVNLNDPEIPEGATGEKINAGPAERVDLTFKRFDKLQLAKPFSLGAAKISFRRALTEWTSNNFPGIEVEQLKPPSTRFGEDFELDPPPSGKDPAFALALTRHGPITRKDSVPITLFLPRQLTGLAGPVRELLGNTATSLHLGAFDFDDPVFLDNQTPDDYLRACMLNGARIKDRIALVVLPPNLEEIAYTKAKRGLGDRLVASQMLRNKTCVRLGRWDGTSSVSAINAILQNTAVQIYDKSLQPGECVWQLARPAGGLDPNKRYFFMGFDVSRSYATKREAAAYAAICDVYGRIITRRVLGSHKGETITATDLSDWFFDAGCAAFDTMDSPQPVEGIFFFKDGPIRPNQLPEYAQGSKDAYEKLIGQKIMTRASDIKVISAVKRGPQRIYGDPLGQRPVPQCAVYLNATQAMTVTSTPRVGTSEVLRLNLDFQIQENMGIPQITRIFNDLRYLDYSSLYMQPKTILPLHIVQNLAKLSKDDIEVPYVPR